MEQQASEQAECSAYLLLETLTTIWKNYQNAGDDNAAKLHWMELFLFYFQYVEEDTLQSEGIKSFIHNIPEEITSYLLETVCNIINESHLSIPLQTAECDSSTDLVQREISISNTNATNSLLTNRSFTPLILNAPSDWSKIIALRQFLTNHIGKHLLRFLLRVDNKLIASQKGLCNLCCKLFPNCKWNTKEFILDTPLSILTVIGSIAPTQLSGVDMHSTAHILDCETQSETVLLDAQQQHEERFKTFSNSVVSSDEIAYLLVQIMAKCVANECEDNLNSQSVSVISLNFALECLCCDDVVYATRQNANTIKLELLQLTIRCINNIFNATASINVLQFQNIFNMLAVILKKHAMEITEIKCENVTENGNYSTLDFGLEFLSASNYVFFYTLQNIIMRLNKSKGTHIIGGNKSSLNDLQCIDEKVIDVSIKTFQQVLQKLKNIAVVNADARMLTELTFRTLLKINEQLFKHEQQSKNNVNYTNGGGSARRRCRHLRQAHCHTQAPTLSCYFQGTLLNLLPHISVDMQEDAVRYLLRIGICCCHYTIDTYASCLHMISQLTPLYQNCTYKFLHRRILYTILTQDHGVYNKRAPDTCAKCDTKLKSLEFRKEILQLYKQLHVELNTAECGDSKMLALQLLLKHLKNISDTLSSDMAAGILAEVILPTFRKFKVEMLQSRKANKSSESKNATETTTNNSHINISFPDSETRTADGPMTTLVILQDCLNIFVAYLGGDIRLIKAFYNEENIMHLEDLYYEPPLVHSICELIKIGIDNVTFLGESNQEQMLLSRRLIMLLLNSSAYNAFQFNALTFNQQIDNEACELSPKKLVEKADAMNAVDILYVTALKWSFIHELLQTSQCFYNALTSMYNLNKCNAPTVEPDDSLAQSRSVKDFVTCELYVGKTIDDILLLNYNALSTFLQLSQCKSSSIPTKRTQSSPQHNTNTGTSTPMQDAHYNAISAEANKEDACLSSSLEYLLTSIEVDALQQTFGSISSSIAAHVSTIDAFSATSAAIPSLTNSDCSFVANAHTQRYAEAYNFTFLDKLKSQHSTKYTVDLQSIDDAEINESVVIFDVRNQQSASVTQNTILPATTTTTTLHAVSVDALVPTSVWSCAANALSTSMLVAGPETNAAVLSIGISIFAKFFSVLGSFFGASKTGSLTDLNNSACEPEIDSNLICLLENSSDSKRYLLRLFETTMAISIKSFKDEGAQTMEKHLLKLKAVILSNTIAGNEPAAAHHEEHSRENAVVKALQSLLKIAEQTNNNSNTTPTAIANDLNGSSSNKALENNASEETVLPSPLRPRARSFNSTRTQSKHSNVTTPRTAAPKRQLSAESGDADYFSTRMSLFCESEMELSENENDTNYVTADEGYEADGEIPEISESETELDKAEFWNSFQPSSRYRTHLLHDGLCHLVVEILIELSERCIANPLGWCECLVQLANRLFVIRASIGDSLFLLRGFAPVLKCGDPRLRELQQSLLELIVDVNTPDVLCTYFNILAAKNPPVDLLIKYLNHICGNKLRKPQAMVELEFPVTVDGKCTSTSDQRITMDIDHLRNQHINAQTHTPLSRTPCIMPITHARLWSNDGFTLSLWLQLKGAHNSKPSSILTEEEARSTHEDSHKTHIVSIGTNQVLLSAYVNRDMKLVFETSKPNAEIPTQTSAAQTPTEPTNENLEERNQTQPRDSPNHTNSDNANTTPTPLTSPPRAGSPSTLRVALKQTKLVILNSFNNMHLFKYHNHNQSYETASVALRHFRFARNRWTHIAFSVCTHQDHLELKVYVDGVEQEIVYLHFRNVRALQRSHAFQLICLGDSVPATGSAHNVGAPTDSRSTVDGYPLAFSLTNLLLFNCKFNAWQTIANLTAMGPDFSELAPLQVNAWRPNYGFVNMGRLKRANFGNVAESMRALYESRLLVYTAESPDIVMGFNNEVNAKEGSVSSAARVYGLILYGELIQNHLRSIQATTLLCGGLSTQLYLFARIVELSSNSLSQYMALDIFLNIALSDSQLYAEFLRINYMSLIGYVVKTDRCTKDVHLLRSILNNACSQAIINKKGDTLEICENTTAIVVYPQLIISILHRYSDWHRSGVEHSDVLDMLFHCILALTREKHPQRDLNLEQLSEAGLLKELLNLCKVYVIESPNPVYISKSAAESFVAILSVFAGSPPSTSLMDEIMKLSLLLQKPSECYITHDRSKFYFLLTPLAPVKERSTAVSSFDRVTTPFRRKSKRERPGIAKPTVSVDKSDLNAKQNERIKRLRRLHIAATSSPFKRNLLELEDNLENVADCARLNKKALRLLSPVNVENWRMKFKQTPNRHAPTSPMRKQQTPSNAERRHSLAAYTPNRISHKRLRHASLNYLANAETPKLRKRSTQSCVAPADGSDTDKEALTNQQIVVSTTQTATTQQRRSRLLVKTDFYSWPGIIALQEGLLTLLKNFLCLLPDNAVEEVLKHYVKVDIILVLCNNSSCAVRTAIIKLLAVLLKRLQSSDINQHVKNLYPQHLANQMSIYTTDMQMFEACLEWVTGVYYSTTKILHCDMTLQIVERFGINTLLSVVINMTNNQGGLKAKAFKILYKMFNMESEQQQLLIDAGLLLCCIKSLFNLYLGSSVVDAVIEESIVVLLTQIGEKSLKSPGQIKYVWDILNMLTFLHEGATGSVIKNLRSAQARLQYAWIRMFFESINEPKNFKVIALPNSNLSLAETKERLRLLIDRCAQFFTICDAKYAPSVTEVELFQLIVAYSIATSQRCNNFIAWGLQPSRPHELRAYIVDALWNSCQAGLSPPVICDGKIIKSFLWLCLLEDLEKPLPNLERLCKHLGINEHDSTWNLESELERIELNRSTIAAEQKVKLEETVYRLESLAVSCIESSMLNTRRVAELQNSERKLLMYQLKDYDDASIYNKWLGIVRRMTHEGAPWHSKERSENSWELDDTEGPSRVHTRLRRCHLDIDKRFFMEDYYNNTTELRTTDITMNNSASFTNEYVRPLEYLLSSYDQQLNISLNSQILYNFPAKFLPVDGEIDGEIIITDHKLYFMATYRCKYFYINCDISSISEIWLKRYQHQEKAFEIFLDTNQSLFFSLQNQEDYKIMYDVFCDKIVTHPDQAKILVITQQWREGLLTNWEYLMTLNQIAGRTYNDLMQYPIFPWILSNYASDILDLTDQTNFRKLEKPVAVQHEDNEEHYITTYTYLNNTMTNMGSLTLKPYHYSSHYSNSGTVLHFLVRVPPFTSYFLRYQDNNFDLPDRTFHSLNTTWNLASRDSPTDVKELIPEFFCLPEIFENFERFDFGCRQNGERVEDVQLPPWCLRDARLFVLIHRQALEAELTRNQLHNWIDLIFGYKQSGDSAVEAINVFHPATYPSFLESITVDPIERRAVETMIRTYGQMPRQLFKNPHPQTKTLNYCLGAKEVLPTVRGLRWGVYLGSPQLPAPTLGNIYKIPSAEYLVSFNNTNAVYGLPMKSCIMQGAEVDTFNVISWDYDDHIVRIQPLNKLYTKPKNILRSQVIDDITACGADPNSNQLWFGHKSGRISIYKCGNTEHNSRPVKNRQNYIRGLRRSYNSAFRKLTTKSYSDESDTGNVTPLLSSTTGGAAADAPQRDCADLSWTGPTILLRHTDEVTSIRLSVEFKIAVSAGRDGIAVIWDLNNWNYVRTIDRPAEIHHSPITVITISPTLGDIVTVHTTPQQLAQKASPERQNQKPNGNSPADSGQTTASVPDECFEVTEESLEDFVNVSVHPNGKSILRLHTVNARYVQHIVHEDRILAATYSYIKEGVGVNVIATAVEGGTIRLWSSWNLSFVSEIITGISNIRSIVYSTHQHLVALTKDSHIQVWETEGLYGNSPKFPQIAYK
ncbi:lysosomal-trafficking regulator isoform X2 [Zeugodacus cucurbitae]|uniref:lysosomal-trafficking regulator isoform X2 n=1 Tax=Zeugodacus cucurbitae TaxID=28588 RepID=UPI0023D93CA5|nr:lysosomal-trafficking regulator isoform X2 [Zeugodacus cucurbitae]